MFFGSQGCLEGVLPTVREKLSAKGRSVGFVPRLDIY